MRAVSAAELLKVWERGWDQPPVRRALELLAVGCPEETIDELADLSVGQRDARLLTLREWTYGPQLVSVTACPTCGKQLELTCEAADIRAPIPLHESGQEGAECQLYTRAGYDIRLRLPNSTDLLAVADNEDLVTRRRMLLERCLLAIQHENKQMTVDQLPTQVVDAIVETMARADPQANVELALACPACGHQWLAAFDIVSFFWSEIEAWASRLLREVHVLATAYGWREADILALSPRRRQCYLEMIGG